MTENTNAEVAAMQTDQAVIQEKPMQKVAQKKVYQYDTFGKLMTEIMLTESFVGANDFGLVADTTDIEPESPYRIFDGGAWVEEGEQYDLALEAAKEEKRTQLNKIRDQKMAAGFECNGQHFDSDASSVQKINGASTMALIAAMNNQPFAMTWTAKDNTEIEFDADSMIALGVTCATHIDQLHHECVSLKNEVMALDSLEDITNFGW